MSNQFLNKSGGPLSIGNVVSAALRIYRDNFKLYYRLAFRAYLWVIIPLYGWAKFATISGLISRLAFSEVNEHPETENEARAQVEPRLWNFFVTGLLILLILFGILVAGGIIAVVIFTIFGILVGQNTTGVIILVLLGILYFIAFLFYYIWFYSRLSIAELPVAIEDNADATRAIGRSWQLTQGHVLRLQLIFFVAFLISLPVSMALQIVTYIIQLISLAIFSGESAFGELINVLANLALTFAGGALLVPFWQAIKAVIYYDLRSRREGMGLQIRDS
jgi:hypothetical protein